MILIQYPQENCDPTISQKIMELENTAWPDSTENEQFPSAPNTYVTSFVRFEENKAICHVGVRKSVFFHKGQKYTAYGLSEVVTHPCYQKQGLASETIKRAAQFIIGQCPDISIFTCDKSKVPFYTRGGWEAIKGACLVGGTKDKPFRSDDLNLVTMIMFISPNSKLHQADFENTDIMIELGENQLW